MDLDSMSEIALLKLAGDILNKPGAMTAQDVADLERINDVIKMREQAPNYS